MTVATQKKRAAKKKSPAPVVSRAQMELAQQMVRNAYGLGHGLQPRQRVALLTRLLYTMRSDVMAAEKQQWAEELFGLAQQLPQDGRRAGGYGLAVKDVGAGQDSTSANDSRNGATAMGAGRDAVIATAAARLAVYDADKALELLDGLPAESRAEGDSAGVQAGARTMAARLVFAGYMQHHPALGAETLLAHGRRWSEQGGFPYSASAGALARLRLNGDAGEDFFRQVLAIFVKGREGLYGVRDFASLLQQAAAMEAIYEETAEEAGKAVVGQLRKFTDGDAALSAEQKRLVVAALNDVRISAPKAYEEASRTAPGLLAVRAERAATVQAEAPKIDVELQMAFHDLAAAMRGGHADETHAAVVHGVQVINAKYKAGACAACASPDAQSWALVSLAAFADPKTIATQLNGIEDPFWHAYFLAIAAQQVGQPTRVADPTARKVAGKEEAETE